VAVAQWHAGTTVLIGDAAHPMTPNLGQGRLSGHRRRGRAGPAASGVPRRPDCARGGRPGV
jgi:hypothetical protein